MEDPEPERVPFDEREALEELERFRQDIERYRSQRKALGEEFEQFIRSFQKPAEMPVPEPPRPAPAFEKPREPAVAPAATLPPKPPTPGSVTPAASAATPAASSPLTPRVVTAPTPALERPGTVTERPAAALPQKPVTPLPVTPRLEPASRPASPIPVPAAQPSSGARTPVLIGVLLVLILGGWAAWTFRPGALRPSSVEQAPITAVVPSPSPAPAPPATPAPLATELTTSRPVWVRVIADGERVVERELPADARVPVKAETTIVIRTGDAGAIRLSIAGRDQGLLGRDGEVVTRTFTVGRK